MANYETLNDLIIFYRLPFVDVLPLDFHWLYMSYIKCLYIFCVFYIIRCRLLLKNTILIKTNVSETITEV